MMRHRPDLCVGGRRREARPPFRQAGFSTLIERRGNRTDVHGRTIWTLTSDFAMWLRARGRRGCRAQRPRRGRGRSDAPLLAGSRYQRRLPGRGRGRRRGSRAAAPAARAATRSSSSRRRSTVRTWPSIRAGSYGSSPRSIAAHCVGRSGDGDRARRLARARTGTCALRSRARRRASAAQLRGVGGSACRCRSLWRTTPIWVETWKPAAEHELGRAAADVDHQVLAGSRAVGRAARRSAAPRRRRSGSGPRSRASSLTRAANAAPLAASRTAEVITAAARSQPCASIVAAEALPARRARAASAPRPGGRSRRRPRRAAVTIDSRASARRPSVISSRVEFEPMSTAATGVTTPDAASRGRRARRAGCRRPCRPCASACGWWPSRRAARRAGSARSAAGRRRAAARAR